MMMFASPLLVGPAPVHAAIEAAALSPVEVAVLTVPEVPFEQPSKDVLALNWSLVSQEQSEGPPAEGAEDEGAQEAADENSDVIIVEGDIGPSERDPAAAFNETSYRLVQDLDQVFLEPVAYAYRDGLPDPLRDGLGNVVRNLGEPTNFINFLLQGKIGKAFETLTRFAINSTVGLGGLIDIAGKKNIGLPHRRNGFANTLGFYGIDPGPYLYLPVTGATTARDLVGNAFNQLPLPLLVGKPFNTPEYTIPFFVISSLDARLEVDEELKRIDATVDPYAARRESYLWTRERDIALLRGDPVPPKPTIVQEVDGEIDLDDFDDEDLDEPGSDEPAVQPSEAPAIMGEATPADAGQLAITVPTTR
jgi:phospholipid-binding lipoprotein MlaA